MADKRANLKQHVRAAKEWLGEAESSLDKEQDLRGDLNLMLAQAELQRAQETQQLTDRQRWFRRSVPVLCAMLLVGGVWQAFTLLTPRSTPAPLTTDRPVAQEAPVPQAAKEDSSVYAPAEAPVREPEAVEIHMAETPIGTVSPLPQEEPEPAVPSRNMQKLMNTAGQSLRAE